MIDWKLNSDYNWLMLTYNRQMLGHCVPAILLLLGQKKDCCAQQNASLQNCLHVGRSITNLKIWFEICQQWRVDPCPLIFPFLWLQINPSRSTHPFGRAESSQWPIKMIDSSSIYISIFLWLRNNYLNCWNIFFHKKTLQLCKRGRKSVSASRYLSKEKANEAQLLLPRSWLVVKSHIILCEKFRKDSREKLFFSWICKMFVSLY
jgi:hypothetical protein